jgi:glycerol uptake facilitator-like aquaporin
MDGKLLRACLMEFVGTFGLVYFAAGVVLVNQLTTPLGQQTGLSPLTDHQPGLLGIALGYGLILTALLSITVPRSEGYLNPAIALMLWVFGRLETRKMISLVAVQLAASLLAAGLLRLTFDTPIVESVRAATPHLNPQAYPDYRQLTWMTGTGIELVLTFFLVLAIFGTAKDAPAPAITAGLVVTVGVLVAYPLTGAAFNPARWFGPCCWEAQLGGTGGRSPWADMVVYVAGPILGSLLAGLVCFKVSRTG